MQAKRRQRDDGEVAEEVKLEWFHACGALHDQGPVRHQVHHHQPEDHCAGDHPSN